MNRTSLFLAGGLAIMISVAALGISAAVDRPSTLMSPSDYNRAKRSIEAQSRVSYGKCRLQNESPRELCRAQARAAERVKLADLEASYYGTVAAAEEARSAKLKAGYDVARARCATKEEPRQAECLREVRELQERAVAVAKLAST